MQSLLACIKNLDGFGDQEVALCAWPCDFLQRYLSTGVIFVGEGVLTHPDMCLEEFLQLKV